MFVAISVSVTMQSTVRELITKMYFKPSIHHIMLAFSTAAQAKDWLKVWLGPASQNRFHESMNSPLAAGVHNTKQNYIIALKSGRRLRRICVEILVHSLSADHMTLWTAHYTEHTRRDEVDRPEAHCNETSHQRRDCWGGGPRRGVKRG